MTVTVTLVAGILKPPQESQVAKVRYQQATALRPLKAGEFATGAGTGDARIVSQTDGRTLLMGGVGVGVAGCNAPAGETGTGTGNPSPLALLLKGHFNRLAAVEQHCRDRVGMGVSPDTTGARRRGLCRLFHAAPLRQQVKEQLSYEYTKRQ